MSRYVKFKSIASEEAKLSPNKIKHGALIIKGNKIVAKGFNNPRSTFLKKLDYCQHAEMAAITSFINTVVRKNPKKFTPVSYNNRKSHPLYNLKDYTVLVVRIPNDKEKLNDFTTVDSSPCVICAQRIYKLGFGKLVYSNNRNQLEVVKSRKYDKVHVCSAQRTRRTSKKKFGDIII
mgnify:CR=1 FL=1